MPLSVDLSLCFLPLFVHVRRCPRTFRRNSQKRKGMMNRPDRDLHLYIPVESRDLKTAPPNRYPTPRHEDL